MQFFRTFVYNVGFHSDLILPVENSMFTLYIINPSSSQIVQSMCARQSLWNKTLYQLYILLYQLHSCTNYVKFFKTFKLLSTIISALLIKLQNSGPEDLSTEKFLNNIPI